MEWYVLPHASLQNYRGVVKSKTILKGVWLNIHPTIPLTIIKGACKFDILKNTPPPPHFEIVDSPLSA